MPAYANQLGGDSVGPRRKHGAEHRHDQIEGAVRGRELLGIALLECGIELFLDSPFSRLIKQIGCDIDSGNLGSGPSRGKREVAGAAGNIEHFHAAVDIEATYELLSMPGRVTRELAVIAGHPGGS
jgi:hypothetical protein